MRYREVSKRQWEIVRDVSVKSIKNWKKIDRVWFEIGWEGGFDVNVMVGIIYFDYFIYITRLFILLFVYSWNGT